MKLRSWSHTPINVDSFSFSFDQMRDQLDGTQQANSNYEENKSSCSRSPPQHKVFKKNVKNPLTRSQNQDMLKFRIYEWLF